MKTIQLTEWLETLESGSRPQGGVDETTGDIPSLGGEHLNGAGRFTWSSPKFISREYYESMPKGKVRKHDILLVKDGATTGKVSLVDDDFPFTEAAVNEHVFIVRVDPRKACPRFVFRFMQSVHGQAAILKDFRGATVGGISRGFSTGVILPHLPVPEQKRIAAILDKADGISRNRHEGVRLTEGLLRSTFLEMFGDPVANPKGWDQVTLETLCDKIIDCPHSTPIYTDQAGGYPCVRSSDLQEGYVDWSTTKYVSHDQYQERIRRHIPSPGEVVYCREGARFGNVARVPEDTVLCLGQRMMLFQADPSIATNEFIWALLDCPRMYHEAQRRVGGSASPHVNVKDIKRFLVVQPSLTLQQQFSRIVTCSDKIRNSRKKAASLAELMFSSLVQRAFKGEL